MALGNTGLAVGAVSRFLVAQLNGTLSTVAPYFPLAVVERPQVLPGAGAATNARLNLFLYEVEIDAAMRNTPFPEGAPAPLWLVLRYLMTAFDLNGESDTADGHDVLGMGMQVLYGLNDILSGDGPGAVPALSDNPEKLKLTFDQGSPDLLSRLMQGPDDKFRCSIAFQIRPVLVGLPEAPSSGMQLVGIDYASGKTVGLGGVQLAVLPSLGPRLTGASPPSVSLGDALTLSGNALNAPGIAVQFGSATLTPSMQTSSQVGVAVSGLDPNTISAGAISVTVVQTLSNGVPLSSNPLGVNLLPTVTGITLGVLAAVSPANPNVYGTVTLAGLLLGRATDYVEFALVQNGATVLLLDSADATFPLPQDQSAQRFAIPKPRAVPPGVYVAVLRVNGQQARQAFLLNWAAP
jgi:Pvc16 N-terminal domain